MNSTEFSSGKIVKPPSLPCNLGGAGSQGKEVRMVLILLGVLIQLSWFLWEFVRQSECM